MTVLPFILWPCRSKKSAERQGDFIHLRIEDLHWSDTDNIRIQFGAGPGRHIRTLFLKRAEFLALMNGNRVIVTEGSGSVAVQKVLDFVR